MERLANARIRLLPVDPDFASVYQVIDTNTLCPSGLSCTSDMVTLLEVFVGDG